MKKTIISFVLLFVVSWQGIFARQDEKLTVATYNIRLQTSADSGARSWDKRKADVAKLIKQYKFDVFGVQEVGNKNQEADLKALIPEFTYFGKGRDNQSGTEGEQIGVFFKSERFEIIDQGSFFLSETPDTISKGWDAAFRRMCVWVKLFDKTNKHDFYVFCTHFDHMGVVARVESAKLIVNRINHIAGDSPMLFLGDLNTSPDATEMYTTLRSAFDDSREICAKRIEESVGTFNGYDVSKSVFPAKERIDYIFCKKISVQTYHVINQKFSNKTYPSDHFPVLIECVINR
jgi:endonuclease/exonuclease/phosphatase family metal-dependent hydrolase